MHELLLFAQIPPLQHSHLLSILAGIAAMQPQPFLERHLVFKPVRAPGSPRDAELGGPGVVGMADGALQAFQAQTKGDTFFVQLVGGLKVGKKETGERDGGERMKQEREKVGESIDASNNDFEIAHEQDLDQPNPKSWTLQFRDLPEVAGRRPVVSRLIADYPIQTNDPIGFMSALGYTQTTSFHVSGYTLTHLSTLFTLSHVLLPRVSGTSGIIEAGLRRGERASRLLDPSGTSLLQISLRIQDGDKPELLTRGISELVGVKELLKGVVELGLGGGERLSLDTRVR